jgi:hypothetical protein
MVITSIVPGFTVSIYGLTIQPHSPTGTRPVGLRVRSEDGSQIQCGCSESQPRDDVALHSAATSILSVFRTPTGHAVQNIPGEKTIILGNHTIGYYKQKKKKQLLMYMCPIGTVSDVQLFHCTVVSRCTQTSSTPCPDTNCKKH